MTHIEQTKARNRWLILSIFDLKCPIENIEGLYVKGQAKLCSVKDQNHFLDDFGFQKDHTLFSNDAVSLPDPNPKILQ